MATVPKVNLKIPQGTTYTHDFNYVEVDGTTPVDLTGYTARMQFRATKESSVFFHEATTANTGLVLDVLIGKVTLIINDADSTAFTDYSGFYDLEIESAGGAVTRIVEGKVTINKEVTR